jgi:hypothetical protein
LKTVLGKDLTFLVDEYTVFRSLDGSLKGLANLKPGMVCFVKASETGDGGLVAILVAARAGK